MRVFSNTGIDFIACSVNFCATLTESFFAVLHLSAEQHQHQNQHQHQHWHFLQRYTWVQSSIRISINISISISSAVQHHDQHQNILQCFTLVQNTPPQHQIIVLCRTQEESKSNLGEVLILFWENTTQGKLTMNVASRAQLTQRWAHNAFRFENFETTQI